MASSVNKDGLCNVKIAAPFDGSLEHLGYSRNGVEPDQEPYFDEVPGDQNGGDQGPPIEIQYLGEIVRVRLEMTRFDDAVADKIRKRCPGAATVGTPHTTGTLLFAEEEYFRLLLHSPTNPMNFPRAIPKGAITANKGTKWQTFTCEFECHKDENGVLWNETTS